MARFGILNTVMMAWLLSLVLPSCGLLKPATDPNKDKVYKDEEVGDIQEGKVYDPNTGTWRSVNEVEGKVDTVRWTDVSEDKYPPHKKTDSPMNGGTTGGGTKPNTGGTTGGNTGGTSTGTGKGNVTILLPFMANTAGSGVPESSQWAVSFYAGAKLAYDDLEEDGVKFTVNVMDSEESSTAKVTSLLRGSDLANSNLIIGPYKRDNVNLLQDLQRTDTARGTLYCSNGCSRGQPLLHPS